MYIMLGERMSKHIWIVLGRVAKFFDWRGRTFCTKDKLFHSHWHIYIWWLLYFTDIYNLSSSSLLEQWVG